MLNKWEGKRQKDERYGWSDDSYIKASAFLDDGAVEDWGCGGGYAKRFFPKQQYIGIDGTGDFCDLKADLREYKSKVRNILIRHVLEHNVDWKLILQNALDSCEKLALVIFTPFGEETKQIAWNDGWEVPDISFKKSDITDMFKGWNWKEEEIKDAGSIYHVETIFYVWPDRKEQLWRQLRLS